MRLIFSKPDFAHARWFSVVRRVPLGFAKLETERRGYPTYPQINASDVLLPFCSRAQGANLTANRVCQLGQAAGFLAPHVCA